jgi:hypothetical protein
MHLLRLLILALALFTVVPAFAAEDAAASDTKPTESLETAIPHIVKLLEARDYKAFIETYANPDDLKKILEEKSVDEIAKSLGDGKARELIAFFKAIQGAKPKLEDNDNKATFEIPENFKATLPRPLVFIRIGTRWYIKN